jgi:S-formylglutathione hydrolase FrmB
VTVATDNPTFAGILRGIMTSLWNRRSLLIGGAIGVAGLAAAGELIEHDVVPGRVSLARVLGEAGQPGPAPAAGAAGPLRQGSFTSAARDGTKTRWVIAYPPNVDPKSPRTATDQPLPVCVVLHGRGDNALDLVSIGYPSFLAQAIAAGTPPFALAAVDGGNDQYWHARRAGGDPGRMVITEFIPRLADLGLRARPSDRIGLLGWSMGGYGALLLGSTLGPGRVAAIAAESPALWLRSGEMARGAFDDADDFQAHDVFRRRAVLERIPIRIDCGLADPFHTAAKRFASELHPHPVTDLGAGDHSWGYWRSKAVKAIEFVGKALTSQ